MEQEDENEEGNMMIVSEERCIELFRFIIENVNPKSLASTVKLNELFIILRKQQSSLRGSIIEKIFEIIINCIPEPKDDKTSEITSFDQCDNPLVMETLLDLTLRTNNGLKYLFGFIGKYILSTDMINKWLAIQLVSLISNYQKFKKRPILNEIHLFLNTTISNIKDDETIQANKPINDEEKDEDGGDGDRDGDGDGQKQNMNEDDNNEGGIITYSMLVDQSEHILNDITTKEKTPKKKKKNITSKKKVAKPSDE
eukprot:TRINITY_DN1880_c3_g2_i1.p1 TRINITY_DN1880_c3_g2~~TRINITY_DN1880_c3_g2_i1.p1  ORF type:complete len:272 (-),score=108.70 TRINITY_DN1880_c3_g2_i1:85-849(-)